MTCILSEKTLHKVNKDKVVETFQPIESRVTSLVNELSKKQEEKMNVIG